MPVSSIFGTIDIGNTFTKLAVFHVDEKTNKKEIVQEEKIKNLDVDFLKNWIDNNSIQKLAYSASGHENDKVLDYLHEYSEAILLTYDTPMSIDILYDTPETLGRDRIAAVLGARVLYPDTNVLVIDAGTCITYEWLTKKGAYLGGNIAPGINMRLQAMHHFTASLPLVKWTDNVSLIGKSTETAILNGAVTGTICEIETFIGRTKTDFIDFIVILTGGDANEISKYLEKEHKIHQDLIHQGLCELIRYNNEDIQQ